MHASVTMRDLLGCISHGCPARLYGRSGRGDLGGEQTRRPERKEWRRSRKTSRTKSLCGAIREADPWAGFGEGRRCRGSNRQMHPTTRRDQGSSILGKTCRDNVGKNRFPAGARSNLQGPPEISVDTRSPGEGTWFGARARRSDEEGVTPFEVVLDVTLTRVTLVSGKGALGTWRSACGQRRPVGGATR